jgi:hypothetical protein
VSVAEWSFLVFFLLALTAIAVRAGAEAERNRREQQEDEDLIRRLRQNRRG